jgi:hypothetical protein
MRLRVVLVGVAVAAVLVGCTTSGETPPVTSAPPTTAPAARDATPAAPTTRPAATTTTAPAQDPVAFFRAQEPVCRAHAEQVGNSVVEPARFAGAKLVRRNTDGTALIEDGAGTQLVVDVSGKRVLPPSGNPVDFMPDPYGFGCPPEVFVGAADA